MMTLWWTLKLYEADLNQSCTSRCEVVCFVVFVVDGSVTILARGLKAYQDNNIIISIHIIMASIYITNDVSF